MTVAIPNSIRRLIHYHYKVHDELLSVPTQTFTVSLKHLKKVLNQLDNEEYAACWIEGPSKSSGRPRLISGEDAQVVLDTIDTNKQMYLRQIVENYDDLLGRPTLPHLTTFHRLLD